MPLTMPQRLRAWADITDTPGRAEHLRHLAAMHESGEIHEWRRKRMAEVTVVKKVCDVCGVQPRNPTKRIRVVAECYRDDKPDQADAFIDWTGDMCERDIDRLANFIGRGTSKKAGGNGAAAHGNGTE